MSVCIVYAVILSLASVQSIFWQDEYLFVCPCVLSMRYYAKHVLVWEVCDSMQSLCRYDEYALVFRVCAGMLRTC